MNKEDYNIYIIGAGVSGLIAAKVLEEHGYSPVIFEASDRAGGRIKTDVTGSYKLDVGFQVLLTEYPAAQKHLDFDALKLIKFKPGSVIFNGGKPTVLGDPMRDISLLYCTVTSTSATIADKLKVALLAIKLMRKPVTEIFTSPEKTTLAYLQDFGFSDKIINNFFKPFFSGIFLEPNLHTSSRMFEFIFKMFGKGYAALPENGIEEIPKQLVKSLKRTTFRYNCFVEEITDTSITLQSGEILKPHYTVVATDSAKLIKDVPRKEIKWNSCHNFYFDTDGRVIDKAMIGLIPHPDALINNVHYPTGLTKKSSSGQQLLSVTVVKDHNLTDEGLINKVKEDLQKYCGITTSRLIKKYNIPKALPALNNLKYDLPIAETRLTDTIFMVGDTLLNGSLNAAMLSGETAALGVIFTIENGWVK